MSEVFWSFYGIPHPGPLIDYVTPSHLGLRVVFVRAVYNNATLRNPANWSISYIGAGTAVTPSVTTVNPESDTAPTYVDLVCTDLTAGEDYQLSVPTGVIQDSLQLAFFTTGLSANYVGVSTQPDIESLTAPSNTSIRVTFTKEMDQTSEYLDSDSYVFDNDLDVLSVSVASAEAVLLSTSSQGFITYTLTVPLSFQDVYLNTIDDNTGTVDGSGITPPDIPTPPVEFDPAEDISRISNRLQTSDKEKLSGWSDVPKPEVEQLDLPVVDPSKEPVEPTATERLNNTRSRAQQILNKIDKLVQKVDQRCNRFKVSSEEVVGSPLFQAMVRVFNERTTTVTYDHYKKALEYRQQLADEDGATLRLE